MEKIRFFYTGSDLEEGKNYFKSLKDYSYYNIEGCLKDYRQQGPNQADINHPAKCPALNRIDRTGWVTFNHEKIDSQESWDLNHVFKNYKNGKDWLIVKYGSRWNVNIPKDHYLFSSPVLYHTKDWFSLPGIIDPVYHNNQEFFQLNSFIMIEKNTVIPPNTPIAQWILVKKPTVEVECDLINENDRENIFFKEYMEAIKESDYERYKQLKRSEFFRGE